DVVERLSVANSHEARCQGVALLARQVVGRRCDPRGVRLGPTGAGETDEMLARAGGCGELVEQLVDASATLWGQGRDRPREGFAWAICGRRASSFAQFITALRGPRGRPVPAHCRPVRRGGLRSRARRTHPFMRRPAPPLRGGALIRSWRLTSAAA